MAKKKESPRFVQHLQSLGFETVGGYIDWCRTHGLETKTHKSRVQVSREVAQVEDRKLRAVLAAKRPVAHAKNRKSRRRLRRLARTLQQVGPVVYSRAGRELPEAWQRVFGSEIGVRQGRALWELFDVLLARARPLFDARAAVGRQSLDYATGFLNLAIRRRHWLRPLADWRCPGSRKRRSAFSSLANHLLAEYRVPEFMAMAWLRDDVYGPAWRDLFLHIGRGNNPGNNPRTGKTPVPLTRRMAHHFLRAPAHYSIEAAIRWAQIMALGGARALADACVATRLGEHFGNDAFWMSVMRWFIAHPTFDLNQVGPAMDFIGHVKFDCSYTWGQFTPALQPGFSMAGRTPDALLRQMERWHARLHRDRAGVPETWATPGIDGLRWETRARRVTTAWTIEALLSTRALAREGREMGHCVASCARRCAAGDCSSLERQGQGRFSRHGAVDRRGQPGPGDLAGSGQVQRAGGWAGARGSVSMGGKGEPERGHRVLSPGLPHSSPDAARRRRRATAPNTAARRPVVVSEGGNTRHDQAPDRRPRHLLGPDRLRRRRAAGRRADTPRRAEGASRRRRRPHGRHPGPARVRPADRPRRPRGDVRGRHRAVAAVGRGGRAHRAGHRAARQLRPLLRQRRRRHLPPP